MGDIITSVNGKKVSNGSDLYRILDQCKVGETVSSCLTIEVIISENSSSSDIQVVLWWLGVCWGASGWPCREDPCDTWAQSRWVMIPQNVRSGCEFVFTIYYEKYLTLYYLTYCFLIVAHVNSLQPQSCINLKLYIVVILSECHYSYFTLVMFMNM